MPVRAQAVSAEEIVARVERLPISWWHVKTRIIIGVAFF
jgi:MFS transporter, putative metabolite:H+ symporter